MREDISSRNGSRAAFTLIELLVVIAIIGVLAGMILPVGAAIKKKAAMKKVAAELSQVETAIEAYKLDKGFYPPDYPATGDWRINTLYYELGGVIARITPNGTLAYFETAQAGNRLNVQQLRVLSQFPGDPDRRLEGIMNVARLPVGAPLPEGQLPVKNYLETFRPNQIGETVVKQVPLKVLLAPVLDENNLPDATDPGGKGLNPWNYNSSSPTNNPQGIDLWADVVIRGKHYRISNWRDEPELLP